MICSGEVDGRTLVCDEEDGVTIEMSALAANTRAATAQRPARLPVPEAPAQQPPAQAALLRLAAVGPAGTGDTEQFYSALEADSEDFEPKAPQVYACSPAYAVVRVLLARLHRFRRRCACRL